MQGFEPVDPRVSFPELERRILGFWREADVFRRQLEQREGAPLWVFYEGPPTANGRPGVHHVEARTFKDVYPRFKAMTGHLVPRKAGWDCHGLPVELEVEKEIGTRTKRDIEAFGIAEFNRRCRESVQRYVGDFERLTERIGFWIDLPDAYWTMNPEYIESVWWSLKQLHERGLLFQDDRISSYCPRCGTPLSDAEVAMGYAEVEDPSVEIVFPIVETPPGADDALVGAALLGWTTTPWTLISNTGVAVDPAGTYVVVERSGARLVLAERRRDAIAPDDPVVGGPMPGASLVGARYDPPFPNVEGAHRVVAADFVSLDEGTGIVHMAPAFGAEDLEIGRREGWPAFRPIDGEGRFTDEAPAFVRGMFFKDADPEIVEDLRRRGRLVSAGTLVHTYPLCWRCSTPLIYIARSSWYVRTTAVKERLLEVNEAVNWFPDHIKHGRYGNWLENNIDWGVSRERYWGTPLPIWICAQGHRTVVGSLTELSRLAGRDVTGIDPHRPGIDEVGFDCPTCGEAATRVPEVIDTWYDSGAMPFAQWGYHPELGRGVERFEERFPADYICEAIDQTRGWFYTLMAEAVLQFDSTAYRNVVCLGLILGEDGRRMSTSLGTAIDPFDILDRQGADALRWLLVTNGSPWASRRVSMDALDDVVRRFLLTLWNLYAFFVTYANAEGFEPDDPPPPASRPVMDRWILSRLASTLRATRDGLEAYDATGAGRAIAELVDDLSNWYVRRSRRRFWNPEGGSVDDVRAAFATLHTCLVSIATALAPFTPFLAEELWRNLAAGRRDRPDSVHLADYPSPDLGAIDEGLETSMGMARAVVELGRRVRTETKTRTRQPLAEAVIHVAGDHGALEPLLPIVAEELNVRRVVFAESVEAFGRWRAKPDFRALGPRLGPRVQVVAAVLARDDGSLAGELAAGAAVELTMEDGTNVEIGPDDVDLAQDVRAGWGVGADAGITVALDLEISAELRMEGIARELIRVVQDARKEAGFEVTDRISLGIEATGAIAEAVRAHAATIAGETLATSLASDLDADGFRTDADVDGQPVAVSVRRV
jgi:isoleucyl-tRNA synthetase